MRADSQHTPLIVIPRPAPARDRHLSGDLPVLLIEDTGPAGCPLFILAAYFLLGIEMVAEEIEEPFGAGGDNLPLERYCATIEASVREILAMPDEKTWPA